MRLFFIAITLMSSSLAFAAMLQLPEARISAKTLGGTVLLIQMKYSLVVDGNAQKEITKELGEEGRKDLFKDIIMSKDVSYLKASYCSGNRKATNDLVNSYEILTSSPEKLTLN